MRYDAVAAVLAALSLGAPAGAVSRLPVDGTASGTDAYELHPVHAGLTSMIGSSNVAAYEPKGPGDPFVGLHGSCFGAMDLLQNRMSGGRYCSLTDGRGEAVALRWTALAPVARGYRGKWELLGGSGWWGDATGSGTFVYLLDPETRRFVSGLTGQVQKP